jgi:hypothetical protein
MALKKIFPEINLCIRGRKLILTTNRIFNAQRLGGLHVIQVVVFL